MKRRGPGLRRREAFIELEQELLGYAVGVGDEETAAKIRASLAALAAGKPVVVQHGYEIDLPHLAGPVVLEADGSVS